MLSALGWTLTTVGGLLAAYCLYVSAFYAIDSGGQVTRVLLVGLAVLGAGIVMARLGRRG